MTNRWHSLGHSDALASMTEDKWTAPGHFLRILLETPEAHFKKHWWSKAEHNICTCWYHSSMQRASLLGNKHSLWPVCLHCSAVLMQEMSSPPDECFLYYYTPPSGSPRRSPSVSAAGGAWQRTASLLGHFPWTVSGPGHLSGPRGNLSSLSPVAPGLCSLLCCTQHRGSGWSPVAVSPVGHQAKKDITLEFDWAPFSPFVLFYILHAATEYNNRTSLVWVYNTSSAT